MIKEKYQFVNDDFGKFCTIARDANFLFLNMIPIKVSDFSDLTEIVEIFALSKGGEVIVHIGNYTNDKYVYVFTKGEI